MFNLQPKIFRYCKRCGFSPDNGKTGGSCNFCNIPFSEYELQNSQEEIDSWSFEEYDNARNEILENIIKKSPEYSQEAYESRKIKQRQLDKEYFKNYKPKVTCPYCHSNNTGKITGGSIVSNGFFGIFSKGIGKQWHCYNCNSDF